MTSVPYNTLVEHILVAFQLAAFFYRYCCSMIFVETLIAPFIYFYFLCIKVLSSTLVGNTVPPTDISIIIFFEFKNESLYFSSQFLQQVKLTTNP